MGHCTNQCSNSSSHGTLKTSLHTSCVPHMSLFDLVPLTQGHSADVALCAATLPTHTVVQWKQRSTSKVCRKNTLTWHTNVAHLLHAKRNTVFGKTKIGTSGRNSLPSDATILHTQNVSFHSQMWWKMYFALPHNRSPENIFCSRPATFSSWVGHDLVTERNHNGNTTTQTDNDLQRTTLSQKKHRGNTQEPLLEGSFET